MKYAIWRKAIRQHYTTIYKPYLSELESYKKAENIIKAQRRIVKSRRVQKRKNRYVCKITFGIFLDDKLIKEFKF